MKQRWDQNVTKFHRAVIGHLYHNERSIRGLKASLLWEFASYAQASCFQYFRCNVCFCPTYLCCSLNEGRWNYPLRSELLWLCGESQSETGRDKQRPGGAASCQTAPRMIEDNPTLERKHPYRPSPCTQPLLLHRRPWWTTGNQQLGQDGAGNSFMTEQNCWKSHSYSAFKGSRV